MIKKLNRALVTLTAGLAITWVTGCSESGGSGSYVKLNNAQATVNGQTVKAVHLSESQGTQELKLDWNVSYASPSKDYQARVYLGTRDFNTITKLFELNCSDSQAGAICGTTVSLSCSIGDDLVNCAGGSPGIRAYVDQPFSQLLIEVCVYDPLFSDFDKNQCQTQKLQFALFQKEDVRLSEYNNLIPEDWVQNGVPGLELEDEGSGNEEEPDEEVPLEENPLYVTQQDNLARWNRQNLTSYLYTLKTTVCSKCDKKDSMVIVVVDNQVSSAFYTPSGEAVEEAVLAEQKTINQWFDYIKSGIENFDSIFVNYKDFKGYPTSIRVDPKVSDTKDNVTYEISEIQ